MRLVAAGLGGYLGGMLSPLVRAPAVTPVIFAGPRKHEPAGPVR